MTELWRLGAAEIAMQVNAGDLSAVEVTQQSLRRLDEINPAVNAVIEVLSDEAMAAAQDVDDKIKAGQPCNDQGQHRLPGT